MKVTEHINKAQSTLFSIELLPPLKGQNIHTIFDTLRNVQEYQPSFVNVTYYREEYVYRDAGNGLLEKRTIRKRPGTVAISAAIKNRLNIDPVPHIICGGFSKEETENALIDLNFLEIDNVLLLRGDPIRSEKTFQPEPDGNHYTVELVDQVVAMNQGIYTDPNLRDAQASNFCIGVAGYPEKHFESPSRKKDLQWLKAKVDRGAEYIITQMFYDNAHYFRFVKDCRAIGINVPIIPGIKPIQSKAQLKSIPQHFHIDLPDELIDMVEEADDKHVARIGVEWSIEQCRALKNEEVPAIHFYTMGRAKQVAEIAKVIF